MKENSKRDKNVKIFFVWTSNCKMLCLSVTLEGSVQNFVIERRSGRTLHQNGGSTNEWINESMHVLINRAPFI